MTMVTKVSDPQILQAAVTSIEGIFEAVYDREAPMMRFLISAGSPLPKPFQSAAGLYLNARLRQELSRDGGIDPARLHSLAEDAERLQVPLDVEGLGYRLAGRVRQAMLRFAASSADLAALEAATRDVAVARRSPFPVDLWEAQNIFPELRSTVYPLKKRAADAGDLEAVRWVDTFSSLGTSLSIRIESIGESDVRVWT